MTEKRNTLLLTVIAVATLLVAVLGATFAYFTATGSSLAESEVEVVTRSIDSSNSSATSVLMNVTLADMLQTDGANDYSVYKSTVEDGSPVPSVTLDSTVGNGGGTRTCTYDLVYTPAADGVFVNSSTNTVPYNEMTINATNVITGVGVSNVTTLGEKTLHNVTGPLTLNDEDLTFTVAGSVGSEVLSQITWNIDVRFYNLALNQNDNAGQTYGGTITFANMNCVSVAP